MDCINFKKIKSWGKYYYGNFSLYKPKTIKEIKELFLKTPNLLFLVVLEVMVIALLMMW